MLHSTSDHSQLAVSHGLPELHDRVGERCRNGERFRLGRLAQPGGKPAIYYFSSSLRMFVKKMIFLSACLALSGLSSYGQEAKGGQVVVTPKSVEKPKEEKRIAAAPPKMTNAVFGKTVLYDGYSMEVLRAEKKSALFDLTAPLDPQKDAENVFFNTGPGVAHPIILFRIRF